MSGAPEVAALRSRLRLEENASDALSELLQREIDRAEIAESRLAEARRALGDTATALERARDALNRDRTGLAAALDVIRDEVRSRHWMRHESEGGDAGSWGSYSWEQHTAATLRREIGWAFDAIAKHALGALHKSGDLAHVEVNAANDAALRARAVLAAAPATRRESCLCAVAIPGATPALMAAPGPQHDRRCDKYAETSPTPEEFAEIREYAGVDAAAATTRSLGTEPSAAALSRLERLAERVSHGGDWRYEEHEDGEVSVEPNVLWLATRDARARDALRLLAEVPSLIRALRRARAAASGETPQTTLTDMHPSWLNALATIVTEANETGSATATLRQGTAAWVVTVRRARAAASPRGETP